MAKAAIKTAKAAPRASASNALIPWDEQLAKDAEIAAGMEANTGGSQFFSVRGGILTFNDAPLPGNQMAAVVLDHTHENVFYEGKFDPNVRTPPTCFAFNHDDTKLAPHKNVFEAGQEQNDTCSGCPMNEWGTADTGRGKACSNTRRLALIPAGTLTEAGAFKMFGEVEHYEKAAVGLLKLPVTSVKGWAAMVKQVAGALGRPPHGIFIKFRVVQDAATQFKVVCEPIDKIPDQFMPAIMARRAEVMKTIEQPYDLTARADAPAAAPAKGGRGAAKAPAPNVRPPVKKRTSKY